MNRRRGSQGIDRGHFIRCCKIENNQSPLENCMSPKATFSNFAASIVLTTALPDRPSAQHSSESYHLYCL